MRFIGASTMLPDVEDLLPLDVFDVFQLPYSALERKHEDVMARAFAADVGLVIRGATGKGQAAIRKGYNWHVWQKAGLDDLLDGMTPTQFILRYTLSNPSLSTAIVGTTSVEHLNENVGRRWRAAAAGRAGGGEPAAGARRDCARGVLAAGRGLVATRFIAHDGPDCRDGSSNTAAEMRTSRLQRQGRCSGAIHRAWVAAIIGRPGAATWCDASRR